MTQNHKGNTQPAIDQEEHTSVGGIDAKKVMVFDNAGNQITSFGGTPNTGNVTINPGPNQIGSVTISHPVSTTFAGNVTLDAGSLTGVRGNLTLSDSKGFIGLTTTVIGSTATLFAVVNTSAGGGNVTLDAGSFTGIKGTVTIQDGGNSITVDATNLDIRDLTSASDSVAIGSGNVTVQAVDLDIRDLTSASDSVAISGGNVTVQAVNLDIRDLSAGQDNVALIGNLTLTDSKGFIGLVTAVPSNTVRSIVGNVTVEQGDDPWNVAVKGNVTLSDAKTFIGLSTIVEGTIYGSPSIAIGMVSGASGALVQFPNLAMKYMTIKAAVGNPTTCYVGGANATINIGFPLDPGESVGLSLTNANQMFLSAVGTTEVRYIGGI